MRIGIDISCWLNQRGQGRYTRELISALLKLDHSHHYWLFVDAQTARQCKDLPESGRATPVLAATSEPAIRGASTRTHRNLCDLYAMMRAARIYRDRIDVFFFPSATTFFPLWRRAKAILTIHDAIPNKYPDLIFARQRNRLLWKLKLKFAIRQVTAIATVSENAKQDIMREFHVASDKISIVSPAVGPLFRKFTNRSHSLCVLSKYGINPSERFILYVGGLNPHKNVGILLHGVAALLQRPGNNNLRLVIAGEFSSFYSHYSSLRTIATDLGLDEKVLFTGFVSDQHLVHFYNAATAFVTASIDEGFGLPALEAMACGTPVVASRAGAIPEIVGRAGLYFDPQAKMELARRLQDLLCDTRLGEEMSREGLLRSQAFTWEQSAVNALRLFERVYQQA